MSDVTAPLEEVLRKMSAMVAIEGGVLALRSYEPDGALVVDYTMRPNEECPTCSIDGNMVKMFLEDSLETHGVPVSDVQVTEIVQAAS